MREWTFEVTILEGNDEFWQGHEEYTEGPDGVGPSYDEVKKVVEDALIGGYLEFKNLRLVKFVDERD